MDGRDNFLLTELTHRCFLQFTFGRNYHSARVRPCSESVSRIRHRRHAAIPRPLPKPGRPSSDVFQNVWQTCILDYELDPAHYYTLPGFTIDACFKCTEQQLDLFTYSEKFLFIENSIRSGISVVSHKHAKANNPLVPDYDHNFPHSYLIYLHVNNLYDGAMSEALPIGDFTFLTEEEVASFVIDATTKSDDYGYILECDLKYPEQLHDLHSD